MNNLVERAKQYATSAHASIDQRRKYSKEPYIVHPAAVVALVQTVPHTPEMIAAAWLHDVVEDVPGQTIDHIEKFFGSVVADLVMWLTNVPKEAGNRKARKEMDKIRLGCASADAQTIKLADLIDNSSSIVKYDPNFARVFIKEKADLLTVLTRGDPQLMLIAERQIIEAQEVLYYKLEM